MYSNKYNISKGSLSKDLNQRTTDSYPDLRSPVSMYSSLCSTELRDRQHSFDIEHGVANSNPSHAKNQNRDSDQHFLQTSKGGTQLFSVLNIPENFNNCAGERKRAIEESLDDNSNIINTELNFLADESRKRTKPYDAEQGLTTSSTDILFIHAGGRNSLDKQHKCLDKNNNITNNLECQDKINFINKTSFPGPRSDELNGCRGICLVLDEGRCNRDMDKQLSRLDKDNNIIVNLDNLDKDFNFTNKNNNPRSDVCKSSRGIHPDDDSTQIQDLKIQKNQFSSDLMRHDEPCSNPRHNKSVQANVHPSNQNKISHQIDQRNIQSSKGSFCHTLNLNIPANIINYADYCENAVSNGPNQIAYSSNYNIVSNDLLGHNNRDELREAKNQGAITY